MTSGETFDIYAQETFSIALFANLDTSVLKGDNNIVNMGGIMCPEQDTIHIAD